MIHEALSSGSPTVSLLDRNAPIYHVETLDQYFAQAVAKPGFITLLLSGFAGLSLPLACLGVNGVISYTVVRRKHEIGIGVALLACYIPARRAAKLDPMDALHYE